MTITFKIAAILLLGSATLISCKKDKDPEPGTNPPASLPETYNFSNAVYPGQTVRLLLADTLANFVIKNLDKPGSTPVTKSQLLAIYENTGNFYSNISTGKKLSDKVHSTVNAQILSWFDSLETRSSVYSGSADAYMTADGLHLQQLVQKSLIGGLMYFQLLSYLDKVETADNVTSSVVEGTKMEHTWDEAFGYFGAARDFKTYTDKDLNDGKITKDSNNDGKIDPSSERCFPLAIYAAKRDHSNSTTTAVTDYTKQIFEAFIRGRADISDKGSYTKRDEAITEIKSLLDKVIASSALKYSVDCRASLVNTGSIDKKAWAELKGFADMIGLNALNKLGSELANVNTLIGSKPADLTIAACDQIATKIKAAYGF